MATGSVPVELTTAPVDRTRVLTSDDALRLERVPTTALIIGGGAVGVEFASAWRSLGAEVTLIEVLDRLLPTEDPSSSAALTQAFRRRGLVVRTGVGLASAKVDDSGVLIELSDGEGLMVDQVLVAVGRRPQTSDLGLEELGVLDQRGVMLVDATGQSTIGGLWAVGDVRGSLSLAHAAFAEGFVVADAIAGLDPTAGRAPLDPPSHLLQPRGGLGRPDRARSPRPSHRRSRRRCFPWPATLGRSSREWGDR